MSVARNIAATYRGPGRVVSRILQGGAWEPRALLYLAIGCALIFVAQLPRVSREANANPDMGLEICVQNNTPLTQCDAVSEATMALAGGVLMAWVFIMPLVFYTVSWLSQGVLRLLRRPVSGYACRIALFWAVLAASPLFLLQGLVAGFTGDGLQANVAGSIAWAALLWFWIAGLRRATADFAT